MTINNGKHHKEAVAGRYALSARKTSCGENRFSVSRENGQVPVWWRGVVRYAGQPIIHMNRH